MKKSVVPVGETMASRIAWLTRNSRIVARRLPWSSQFCSDSLHVRGSVYKQNVAPKASMRCPDVQENGGSSREPPAISSPGFGLSGVTDADVGVTGPAEAEDLADAAGGSRAS